MRQKFQQKSRAKKVFPFSICTCRLQYSDCRIWKSDIGRFWPIWLSHCAAHVWSEYFSARAAPFWIDSWPNRFDSDFRSYPAIAGPAQKSSSSSRWTTKPRLLKPLMDSEKKLFWHVTFSQWSTAPIGPLRELRKIILFWAREWKRSLGLCNYSSLHPGIFLREMAFVLYFLAVFPSTFDGCGQLPFSFVFPPRKLDNWLIFPQKSWKS